jgi:zinc protease
MRTRTRFPSAPVLLTIMALAPGCGAPSRRVETAPPPVTARRLPSPSEEERRPPPETRRRELPVIELRNAASPLVTFRVVFEAGSADDPQGHEGMTYLLARTMAEGGTESLTYEELTRRLFPMAARIAFHVDRDMTVFEGQVHRDHLAAFYPLLRDVILHPRLSDEDFRRVKSQTESALTLELRGNNDEELGKEFLQSLIYSNHPYGHPALGTERGLAATTLDDARTHRGRVFCRDRVLVGLAGGYPEDLAARVRQDLEQLPPTCAPRAVLPMPARPQNMHVVVIDKPSASATAVSLGLPITITRAEPDFPALQFVTHYLGLHRQSSGVLYQTIREARGLNYGDYAYAEHFEQEGYGRFPRTNIQRRQQYASIWLRPLRPPTAHFALRAAVRALARTLDAGIPQEDFERNRTFLAGYVNLFAQTESARLGYALDDFWNHATGGSYAERMRAAWTALDRNAALAVARRQLSPRDLWVAIVAPNARELADAIGRNAPSPMTYDSPKPDEVLAEDREIAVYPLAVRPEDVRIVPLSEVFR